jgi:hypothetical protein
MRLSTLQIDMAVLTSISIHRVKNVAQLRTVAQLLTQASAVTEGIMSCG